MGSMVVSVPTPTQRPAPQESDDPSQAYLNNPAYAAAMQAQAKTPFQAGANGLGEWSGGSPEYAAAMQGLANGTPGSQAAMAQMLAKIKGGNVSVPYGSAGGPAPATPTAPGMAPQGVTHGGGGTTPGQPGAVAPGQVQQQAQSNLQNRTGTSPQDTAAMLAALQQAGILPPHSVPQPPAATPPAGSGGPAGVAGLSAGTTHIAAPVAPPPGFAAPQSSAAPPPTFAPQAAPQSMPQSSPSPAFAAAQQASAPPPPAQAPTSSAGWGATGDMAYNAQAPATTPDIGGQRGQAPQMTPEQATQSFQQAMQQGTLSPVQVQRWQEAMKTPAVANDPAKLALFIMQDPGSDQVGYTN